jgi:signal transduction histidine kinase
VYLWIKDIYIEQTKIDLLHNINILSLGINDFHNLDKTVLDVKKSIGLRVTIINHDGVVIAESDEDKTLMENHSDRAEVINSKYQEYGSIVRKSDTLEKMLLYVSKKFKFQGEDYYIRMARDIEQINEEFFYLSLKIGILFLFFITIAFWVARTISKKVEHETTDILDFLTSLTKHNKNIQIESNYSYEFHKITQLLSEVSKSLIKKEKQKSKYTAKLKLSNRQKDDIISAISHEFKNPIAVISGYTQTLLDDEDINPKIREKFLKKISSNSDKLTTMIDRLRLTLRLEDEKKIKNFTKVDIVKVVKNTIDDLKISYPSREIHLEADDMKIEADETMIRIAIENLIENGLKYSQDDVFVTITNETISVKDNGIGIKEKDIQKITHKFYRVSNNTWNNSLGVGLSLVSNIVKFHKFKLEIQSVENEGSTFTIRL